ncbi:hypothetical protein BN9982_1540009 [Mycobacterium tuberculosis]|nr:hypothetical protein BN9982_1540009 [Mycobacterium tuberculosis]
MGTGTGSSRSTTSKAPPARAQALRIRSAVVGARLVSGGIHDLLCLGKPKLTNARSGRKSWRSALRR